jgi:DNA-binding NarL/FixJ family response regulator
MEELARTKQVDTKKDPRFSQLTAREMDVVKELGEGRTNQEIAQRLFLTENTVKYHVHSILTKLGLDGRKEVAYMALECGIVKNRDRVRQEETILQ